MKQLKLFVSVLVAVTIVPTFVNAQLIFNGHRGLNYVNSAWNLEPGFLTLKLYSRGYRTTSKDPTLGSLDITDVTGRLNINYGINKNVEVGLISLLYEDTNSGSQSVNTPGDVLLTFKFASLGSPGSAFKYGFLVGTKLPLGKVHNIPFEPYSTNKVSFGAMGLVSYSQDPLYPTEALNVHFNLGYWNHNDVGAELIEGGGASTQPSSMSQEILYALGVRVPKNKFKFAGEIYGNAFIKAPPTAAYSRESYLYLSPSVHYKVSNWFDFNLGLDIKILSSSDKTLYAPAPGGVLRTLAGAQPNYPGWRVNFGTHFSLLPTRTYRPNDRDILFQKAQSRRELFEKIVKEQRDTESAEAELERIKAERLRAEKELERLRKILEGELKKEQPENQEKKENNGN
ncbi:MAG: transporter [bacterium]